MEPKKTSNTKTITLEKLEAEFKKLKVPADEAHEYLASTEAKADKRAIKAKVKFEKREIKWEKGALKRVDKDLDRGIKWARKHVGI